VLYTAYDPLQHLKLHSLLSLRIARTVLKLADTRFRAISRKIIISVYKNDPSYFIKGEIKNRGWTIIVTEYKEEWNTGQV
jgi:hypothetical protein